MECLETSEWKGHFKGRRTQNPHSQAWETPTFHEKGEAVEPAKAPRGKDWGSWGEWTQESFESWTLRGTKRCWSVLSNDEGGTLEFKIGP